MGNFNSQESTTTFRQRMHAAFDKKEDMTPIVISVRVTESEHESLVIAGNGQASRGLRAVLNRLDL